jgi:hypothetical protein
VGSNGSDGGEITAILRSAHGLLEWSVEARLPQQAGCSGAGIQVADVIKHVLPEPPGIWVQVKEVPFTHFVQFLDSVIPCPFFLLFVVIVHRLAGELIFIENAVMNEAATLYTLRVLELQGFYLLLCWQRSIILEVFNIIFKRNSLLQPVQLARLEL